MNITQQDQRILALTLQMLGSGQVTSQNLDDFVISYSTLGRLVAIAQGEAEKAEQDRKIEWAKAFTEAKMGENKVSDKMAEVQADLAVADLRNNEIKARERMTMLKNTRESVWEGINAIKYLGRMGG